MLLLLLLLQELTFSVPWTNVLSPYHKLTSPEISRPSTK
jgi:hypothetical protein